METSTQTIAGTFVASPVTRRAAVRLGGGALAAGLFARHARRGAVAAQDGAGPAAPEPFDGDAYVGETDVPGLFAAVVIDLLGGEVRAYLCDGAGLVAWFAGPVSYALKLSSDDGSVLTATPGGARVAGEARLTDGRIVAFTAHPATGIEGLYEVVVAGGRVVGQAAGGLRLDGVVAAALPDGTLLLAGAVAQPEGGMHPLAVFATPDADGEQRWIVLGDGRVTGGPKGGAGSGFIDPTLDTIAPMGASFVDPTADFTVQAPLFIDPMATG